MYQPQVPLIPMSPRFKTQRLAQVELGQLLLLRDSADAHGGAGLGVRADALSAQGELIEGLVRLSGGPTRFEQRALQDNVIALQIDYLLEADLAHAAIRPPESGDLLVSAQRPGAALFIGGVWPGAAGLLDLAAAVIRPFGPAGRTPTHVALTWRLVERDNRTRTLLERAAPEPLVEARPRRAFGEDCD